MVFTEQSSRLRPSHFPSSARVRACLALFDGQPQKAVTSLIDAVLRQRGTPQDPVDWSDPDAWIGERLAGEQQALARRIWEQSGHVANPRYLRAPYRFVTAHRLMASDGQGLLRLTERGRAFLDNDGRVVREVDAAEGLLHLLGLVATQVRARLSDLVGPWGDYLCQHGHAASSATIYSSLRLRLAELAERDLVRREGNIYEITPQGLDYLGSAAPPTSGTTTAPLVTAPTAPPTADPKREVLTAVRAYNAGQRAALRDRLAAMPPYRFEHLVRDLLAAMGYEDATVTRESGDKGIDVVATIQFGITTITEVVQVKRQQGSIGRPVLDQLRGALPLHKALRGTIITLGEFSRGCIDAALYPGAAPIGLIDGERLLDLLVEHGIGVRKQALDLHEVDEEIFAGPSDPALAEEGFAEEGAGR